MMAWKGFERELYVDSIEQIGVVDVLVELLKYFNSLLREDVNR